MHCDSPRFQLRPSVESDIPTLLMLAEEARQTMRASGNLKQWSAHYPDEEVFRRDIGRGGSFLILEGEEQRPVATFAFLPSPEPTYARIEGGCWLEDTLPYFVVHRIAALRGTSGIFSHIMRFCDTHTSNLRIDTHRDNLIMRHLLTKHGFRYCGIIYLANGDERLAFQRLR